MGGDSSSCVSSGVENSAMVTKGRGRGGERGRGRATIQEDLDTEIRIHIIVPIVIKTIIHQISIRTSLVNLSGVMLVILHPLQLQSPPMLLLLCRSSK